MTRVKVLNCLLRMILAISLCSLAWLAYVIATAGPEVLRHSPVFWVNIATYPLYAIIRKQHRRAVLTAGLTEVRDGLTALTQTNAQANAGTLAAMEQLQAQLKR